MKRILIVLALALVCLAGGGVSLAAGDLSLPLGGNYRTGKYMPVQFAAETGELRLVADGAIATQIQAPSGGVAPFLAVRSPLHDAPFTQPLHELTVNERLVGSTIDAKDIAAALFPGQTIVSVQLDAVHPLAGPAAAWQSLDAVVLDAAASAAVNDQARRVLLAGGTTLAIAATGAEAPDAALPWQKVANFWVLRPPATVIAAAGDEAYAPVSGWTPGRSEAYRRKLLLIGGIVAIVVITAAMKRSLWWTAVAAAVGAMALILIPVWNKTQMPLATAVGIVEIGGQPAISDTWVYQHAAAECRGILPFGDMALPMMASTGGADQMTIVCGPTGTPLRFEYRLQQDRMAAFVFKGVMTLAPVAQSSTITSPVRLLVNSMYPGMTATGETSAAASTDPAVTQWPTVILSPPASSEPNPK